MRIIPLWVDGSEHRIGKSGPPKRSYPNVAFSCKCCAISTRIVAQWLFTPARPEDGWKQGKCQTWNPINAWPITLPLVDTWVFHVWPMPNTLLHVYFPLLAAQTLPKVLVPRRSWQSRSRKRCDTQLGQFFHIFPVQPEKVFETIWWITPVSQSMVYVTIFSIFELVLQVGANHQGANRWLVELLYN